MSCRLGCWRCPNARNKCSSVCFILWLNGGSSIHVGFWTGDGSIFCCCVVMSSHQVSCQHRDYVPSMRRWLMNLEHLVDENWQGKPKYSQKTSPSVTLSNTNPTWSDLGSNPDLGCGKPSTSHLSNDTVQYLMLNILWRIDPLLGNDSVNALPRESTRATIGRPLQSNGSVNKPFQQ
jgi:hypothetical protein